MTEAEYIRVSDLARVRIAMQVVWAISEKHGAKHRKNAMASLQKIEDNIEAEMPEMVQPDTESGT